MAYRVEFAARAARDLEVLYVEKNVAESQAASRWYNRLEDAIFALEMFPYRCPVTPEARKLKRRLRQLLYGNNPHVYRVIYEVDELHRRVRILTIRHGARKQTTFSDMQS
jgi:toxin ParE1/3/4